jgi:hypothetical protein
MTPTTVWRIETAGSVDIIADALLDEMPEYRRGESRSFTFSFRSDRYTTGDGGFQYGDAQWGTETYSGGSSGDSGALTRYVAARELLEYAGAAATGTDIESVPYYREQLPARASIDSALVALVPSAGLQATPDVRGVWGVVVGGEDGSRAALSSFEVTLEVFILAEYGDYDGRQAVETEFIA